MTLHFNCHAQNNLQHNVQTLNSFLKNAATISNRDDSQPSYSAVKPEHLFKRLRMIWNQLEDVLLEDKLPPNFDALCQRNEIEKELRNCVIACGNFVSDATKSVLHTQIKLFRKSVICLNEMEEFKLCKLNSHALKNETSGVYYYFHSYLHVKWFLIALEYCLNGYSNDLRLHAVQLIKDLTSLAHLEYTKSSMHKSDPFLCPCVKTLWICVQILAEKQSCEEFWSVFNEALKETDAVFSLWLLRHIGMLQGYEENGNYQGATCKRVTPNQEFLETKLKQLLSSEGNKTENLKCCLMNIEPLVNTWWCGNVKVTIFQLLWEYFYKTLNAAAEEDTLPTKASKILSTVENLCGDPFCATTAFQLFVGILAKYLDKNGNQWCKLKGRIYSRLPVKSSSKLSTFSFYNVYLLFMCLSPVDFEELTGRICSMLENLPEDQQNSVFVLNLYCALIMLYLRNERSVDSVGKNLVSLIQENVKSRQSFSLIRHFINNLEDVMNASSNYTLGQFVFFDSWIKKYLQHCHTTDVEELLKVLTNIVDSVYISDVWSEWDPVFQIHVFPCLKQLATVSGASPQIGVLAATLCKVSAELSNQGIAYFTDDPVDPKVSSHFVLTLVQSQLVPAQENCVIRAWLRCCILSTENSEELTKSVLGINSLLRPFRNKLHANPFCEILEILTKQPNNAVKENTVKLLLDSVVNIDVWVKTYIKEPKNEATTLHIYTCAAVLVYNFAASLYNKTKSACLLSRIISTFLLPAEVLMGRTPHTYTLHAVQRTWHLFFKGICSLNWSDDQFLERTLRDLIVCYVPHFPTDHSPLLKCFDDQAVAAMVLNVIATAFLRQSSKCNKQQSLKVLRFLDHLMSNCTCLEIMRFVAKNVLPVLLEFLLFNLHCNAAVSVLISLNSSDFYEAVKSEVHQSIVDVTEKHLMFSSNNYFQLVQILVKVIPADVKALLPKIKETVVAAEKIRGDGFDSTLRKGLLSIETALASTLV